MTKTRMAILAGLWLILLAFVGSFAVTRIIGRSPASTPSRRIESGTHVAFVVVAPLALPDGRYVAAVARAREAFRDFAERNGLTFWTVGVCQAWDAQQGLAILDAFGSFDELIVGRSWFNSGVVRYVMDYGAVEAVPQVVGVLETIKTTPTSWTLESREELGRFIGPEQLKDWEEGGALVYRATQAN